MMSIGSNIASSSTVDSSKGPLACAWISLTLEDQLANFRVNFGRIFEDASFIGKSSNDAFFESIAKIVKELRIDPWMNIERLLYQRSYCYWKLHGATPLHWAVLMGDRTMVQYILTSKKVDINASKPSGVQVGVETALNYAIVGGNYDIIEDLLEHKADVCIGRRDEGSPLYSMVRFKDSMFGILQKVLANNVNICDEDKNTCLHYAAMEGAIDVMRYLLDQHADVNMCNEAKRTPLHEAVLNGSLDVVTCLLEQNADVNVRDLKECTPLHYAVQDKSPDVATCLLEQNADVNVCDQQKCTPLHYAVQRGSLDVVTCLLQRNVDVNVCDRYMCTPLHYAVEKRSLDLVTCLLQQNADVNVVNDESETPLTYSLSHQNADTFNALIANGANVHFKDKNDNNLLHCAIHAHSADQTMDIVKFLREHDVDANSKNSKGHSPFFIAVYEGQTDVVKELLQSKEKINSMEECNGQIPIEVAFDHGDEHIKRMLLECDDVSRYVSDLYRDRQVYVDAANAILVGAALIAGVTFASWLQPPLGYTTPYVDLSPSSSDIDYVDVQHNVSLRAFWIFNTLSFYFAIGTVVFGARSVLPRRRMFIKAIVVKLHQNLLVTSILLACSVFFVIIAFGIAGCIVLTPTLKFQWYMIAPTLFGGFVCLVSLVLLFKSMVEDNLEKKIGFFDRHLEF